MVTAVSPIVSDVAIAAQPDLLNNVNNSTLATWVAQGKQALAATTAKLQQIDLSNPDTLTQGLQQAAAALNPPAAKVVDLAGFIGTSQAAGLLTPTQASGLTQMNALVNQATALVNTPLTSSGVPVATRLSASLSDLGTIVTGLAGIVTVLPGPSTALNGLTMATALLTISIGMANVMSVAVNNYQTEVIQMNTAQQLVQDAVNVILQLSASLKSTFNTFVQLAANAGVTPPSDLSITNISASAQTYDAATINYTGSSVMPTNGIGFWPGGIPPLAPGSSPPSPLPVPSNVWPNINLGTAFGQYCLNMAGVPFAGLVDPEQLVNVGTSVLETPTVGNAINYLATNQAASTNFSSASTAAFYENTIQNPSGSASFIQTGENLCFLASQPGGAQIQGSLTFSSALFALIPPSYQSNSIVTTQVPTTSALVPNLLPSNYVFVTTPNPIPAPPPPGPPPAPPLSSIGYVSMEALSGICQTVLTQAGFFLPTKDYFGQITSALGNSTTPVLDPNAPNLTSAGQPTTVNTLGGISGSISQIPANLTATIQALQQQAAALVTSVTQLYQAVNQLLDGSNSSAAFSIG